MSQFINRENYLTEIPKSKMTVKMSPENLWTANTYDSDSFRMSNKVLVVFCHWTWILNTCMKDKKKFVILLSNLFRQSRLEKRNFISQTSFILCLVIVL